MSDHHIRLVNNKQEEKFLRKPTLRFSLLSKEGFMVDGKKVSFSELAGLVSDMRKIMHRAHGIGLSANQIGVPYRLFVAGLRDADGKFKFYAVVNPEIEKSGAETAYLEEGCLSIPRTYGNVPRATTLTLRGLDKRGKPLKIRAWGLLARVFQHETDHLDGKLFIDRTKDIHVIPESERLAKRGEAVNRESN